MITCGNDGDTWRILHLCRDRRATAEPSCSRGPGPPTRLLEDGDRSFEVIHTPGHSPGGIALLEEASGILFSGDIVYDGPMIEDAYHDDAKDYEASMLRLLDVPIRVVHGGHFPSYGAVRHRDIIRAWLDAKDRA